MIPLSKTWGPFLLLSFLLIAPSAVRGQGVAQDDLLAPIGTTWDVRAIPILPPEQLEPEPVVWSYGGIDSNELFGSTFTILDPSTVENNGQYPEADIVLREQPHNDPDATKWTFYDVGATRARELGSIGPVFTTQFLEPAMAYRYPLEEGASEAAEYCYTAFNNSGSTAFCGVTRIAHSATGTLVLPFGSFNNVQLITTTWSFLPSDGSVDSTYLVIQDWYKDGTPYPMLHITKFIDVDGSITRKGQVLDESSVVGLDERVPIPTLRVHPVPTSGRIWLALEPSDHRLEVFSADGRSVLTGSIANGTAQRELDLTGRPAGVYHVVVSGVNGRRTARIVLSDGNTP